MGVVGKRVQKFRQTEAARLVRAAQEAGLAVKSMSLAPDGTVSVVIGEGDGELIGPARDNGTELREAEAQS